MALKIPSTPPQETAACSAYPRGQVFCGELPGNLLGAGTYRATASDEYGNAGTTLHVAGTQLPSGAPWWLTLNSAPLTPPLPLPGIALLNVAGLQYFLFTGTADLAGRALTSLYLPTSVPSGAHLYFQLFTFPGPAGDLFASSKGLEVVLQ